MSATVGQMRHRAVIQSPSYSASTQSGQGAASYSTLATVWAAVRPVSGGESLNAGSVSSQVTYDVEIRHRTDVTPGMRVQWTPYGAASAMTLEVLAVMPSTTIVDRMILRCGVTQ